MPRYRRAVVPGGTFFFTVVTRSEARLFRKAGLLRLAADGRAGKDASPPKQRQRRRGLWLPRGTPQRAFPTTIPVGNALCGVPFFSHHFDDVHDHAVKHGLVNRTGDWPWSSFHRRVRGERVSGRLGRWFGLRHERVHGAFDRRTVTPKVMYGCMSCFSSSPKTSVSLSFNAD